MSLLGRFRRSPRARRTPGRDRATHDDVYFCYRLILRREPDPAGESFWARQIDEQHVSVDFLVDRFLESDEFLNSSFARTLAAGSALKLVDVGDFRIYVRGHDFGVGAALLRDKVWEEHVVREIRRVLGPGGVFLDLGAGIGYFSLLAASIVGDRGQVFAFEPEPGNFGLLTLSINENGFSNVQAHPHAVSDREESVLLGENLQIANAAGHRGDAAARRDGGPSRTHLVRTVVLDHVLDALDRLDLIKIDIEGAEPRALEGMRTLIARHRPIILTEFFPGAIQQVSARDPRQYLSQLRGLGYELFVSGASDGHALTDAEIVNDPRLTSDLMIDLVARPVSP
jgi:FkbM family methyltransferase